MVIEDDLKVVLEMANSLQHVTMNASAPLHYWEFAERSGLLGERDFVYICERFRKALNLSLERGYSKCQFPRQKPKVYDFIDYAVSES